MANNRYKELIKENNERLNNLSDSYKKITDIYVKKARGYGIKALDTEIKIQEVLEEVENYENKNIPTTESIPNITDFVETRVAKLSKALSWKFRIKEIIAVSIFILCIVGYFVLTKTFDKKTPLEKPTDVVVEITSTNSLILSWRHNTLAKEGYYLTIYKSGESKPIKSMEVEMWVEEGIQTVVLKDVYSEKGITYVFEIYCLETENFNQSEVTTYEYICS